MIPLEEIKKYLPQYLSSEEQDQLFYDIRNFPDNLESRFYSYPLVKSEQVYQGDGIVDLLVFNLPSPVVKPAPSMIISNSCDIDQVNQRLFGPRALYSPIFQLNKYMAVLISEHVENGKYPKQKIIDHIKAIKRQEITQIFYLPAGSRLENDSIVFLDRIINCPMTSLYDEGRQHNKIFTLSNYGFYVLMIKLSIHFTRIREGIKRSIN